MPSPEVPTTTSGRIVVNGVPRTAGVDELGRSLAVWLRENCAATDTKIGCEEGVCGSCTVLLDGEPVPSCLVPVADCDGRAVATAGHLAAEDPCGRLVARCLAEVDSPQCGFCVGGLLVTATALVGADVPSDAAIRAGLAAHLCRCGGYPRHEAAVALARRRLEESGA